MKEKEIAELMYLALKVQMNTKYCVFIDYSGHVDWLQIKIRKSKKEYNTEIAESMIYTERGYTQKRFNEVKDMLLEILKNGEIDYDLCEVEEFVEVHRQYTF